MTAKTPKPLSLCALLLALALPLAFAPSASRAQGDTPAAEVSDADDEAGSEGDDESAAESRATGFRAVDGAQVEDVPGGLMLVGAYGAIVLLLLGFLLRQQSQLSVLASRIDSLRAELERARGGDGPR